MTDCKKEYVDLQWQHGNQFSMHHHIHTFWLEMFASYILSVFASVLMIFFWSIFLFCCWIKDLWLRKSLSSCVKWDIKGIIKPKKPGFHAKHKCYIILIYSSSPRSIFKKAAIYFLLKIRKVGSKKLRLFWLTFLLSL